LEQILKRLKSENCKKIVKCRQAAQSCESTPGAGLPDDIFSNQEFQFGQRLEGLVMDDVGMFYGHLVDFPAIWLIFRLFGIFCVHLVAFSPFGVGCTKKNLATLARSRCLTRCPATPGIAIKSETNAIKKRFQPSDSTKRKSCRRLCMNNLWHVS
jgi:hypothetical protein